MGRRPNLKKNKASLKDGWVTFLYVMVIVFVIALTCVLIVELAK